MFGAVASLALLAGAQAPVAVPSLVAVLDASRDTCSFAKSGEAYHAGLRDMGWVPATLEPDDKLAAYARKFVSSYGATASPVTYRRTVAGESLVLVIFDVRIPMGGHAVTTTTCQVYGTAIRTPPEAKGLRAWAKRSGESSGEQGAVAVRWEPGLGVQAGETTIAYVPAELAAEADMPAGYSYSAFSKNQ